MTEELAKVTKDVESIRADITDIKENHLTSLLSKLSHLEDRISDLRWFFMAGLVILGVVLAILEVYG